MLYIKQVIYHQYISKKVMLKSTICATLSTNSGFRIWP